MSRKNAGGNGPRRVRGSPPGDGTRPPAQGPAGRIARVVLDPEAAGAWPPIPGRGALPALFRRLGELDPVYRGPAERADPVAGELASRLSALFAGREPFCRRLGVLLEGALRVHQGGGAAWGAAWGAAGKQNVLLLGARGAGKTHLLSRVLPQAIHGFLREALPDAAAEAPVVYVDARHLREARPGSEFGPVPCAQLLVKCGSEDPERWARSHPVVVCVDHLESVWERRDGERRAGIEPEAFAAALAAVLRGVQCALPPSFPRPAGPPPFLSTGPVLFVAAAGLPDLRDVLERRVGETGTCELLPGDLLEAGMPACLLDEFPALLPLPPLSREGYRSLLRRRCHPGFEMLSGRARLLGAGTVEWEPDALEALFLRTWNGGPDFRRLGQILSALGEVLPAGGPAIGAEQVEQCLLRSQVLPGDVGGAAPHR